MKLTTKGRYAVAAMADLASRGPEARASLCEIAARQRISRAYLEQIFAKLRRAQLVTAARGAHGGYALAARPEDISVAAIMAAADETIRTTSCVPGAAAGCLGGARRCLTHDLWERLGAHIEDFLEGVTLRHVIDGAPGAPDGRLEASAIDGARA